MFIIILLLTLALSILFGINNASVCQAGIVSSRLFTFKRATIIIGLGLLLGSVLEGWKTKTFISGIETVSYSVVILMISTTILFLFTFYKVPVSVAHVVTGGWLGVAFKLYGPIVTGNILVGLIVAWSLTPFISLGAAIGLYKGLKFVIKNWPILKLVRFNRIALIFASFYTSYSLGSNNIGLILGISNLEVLYLVLIVFGVLTGSIFLSRRFVKAIGEDFLVVGPLGVLSSLLSGSFVVWILTQFGYPGSLTNGILGALVGIGIISKPSVINVGKLYSVVLSWIFGGLIGFFLSFLATQIF